MTKYKITAGEEFSWEAHTDDGFVDGLRKYSRYPSDDNVRMMRTMAASFCDWTGKSFRFSSVSDFVEDCVQHGVMEVSDAERTR